MTDPADPTRHDATILRAPIHAGRWYWWRCACGAQSGPPFYASARIASIAWAEHVQEAEEASR